MYWIPYKKSLGNPDSFRREISVPLRLHEARKYAITNVLSLAVGGRSCLFVAGSPEAKFLVDSSIPELSEVYKSAARTITP